jgi:cell division protein FtsB
MRWKFTTVLVGTLIALQYTLWFGDGNLQEVLRLQKQIALQESEVWRLKERNQMLQNDVLDLKHGTGAIEEYARTELGMIKKNELFFLVGQ